LDFVFALEVDLTLVFDVERFAFDPDFVFDRALVFVLDFAFAFDDVFDLVLDDLPREDVFRVELPRPRVDRRPLPSPPPSSPESSSELRSFFATPTAAGIATPSAVPATTFLVVDRPSSSSFDMLTSRAPASRRRAATWRR
jgi:hypothetical protein